MVQTMNCTVWWAKLMVQVCHLVSLLLQPTKGVQGGTENLPQHFLCHFQEKWHIKALLTRSDKNASEINASQSWVSRSETSTMLLACPRCHQDTSLHLLTPAWALQHSQFPWIDKDFLPLSQQKDEHNHAHGSPGAGGHCLIWGEIAWCRSTWANSIFALSNMWWW